MPFKKGSARLNYTAIAAIYIYIYIYIYLYIYIYSQVSPGFTRLMRAFYEFKGLGYSGSGRPRDLGVECGVQGASYKGLRGYHE